MGGFSAADGVETKEKMLELERKGGHRIEHTFAAVKTTVLYIRMFELRGRGDK